MGFLYEDYNHVVQRHEGMLAYCYAVCKKPAIVEAAGMETNNRAIVNRVWAPLDPATGVRKKVPNGYEVDKETWRKENPMKPRPTPPF